MEYTVQKLARLADVSARTLRYYDEIGLLKPARTNSSGYRIYGRTEVDRLQQILFYRELGMGLEQIRDILNDPSFDAGQALAAHRERLLDERRRLDLLIANVEKTLAMRKGRITMDDQEKFEGFKRQLIEQNEARYGAEIRTKYGEDAVKSSNAKLKGMTQEEFARLGKLEQSIKSVLAEACRTGDPAGELAQQAAELHRQWLTGYWTSYNKEAHASIAQMYVDDERFQAYYDAEQPGTAAFLRDAVRIYVERMEDNGHPSDG